MARFIYGPLPASACVWLYILRIAIIIQGFLFLNAIIITRYMLIFWLQNPAAFQDKFWILFINVWAKVISFLLPIIRTYVPGNQLLEYYICTGQDPSEILHLPSFARGFMDILSVILHIVLYTRIAIYKRKKLYYVGPETRHSFFKNETITDLEASSLLNFSTNIFLVVVIALGVVLASFGIFKTCQDFKKFPNYVTLYYLYLCAPCFVGLIAVGLFYYHYKHLRDTMFRELRDMLCHR